MIDQYKKEMSQIHASEKLVKKTREQVRREEERLLKERAPKTRVAKGIQLKQSVALLSVAAAAFLVVLFSRTWQDPAGQKKILMGQKENIEIEKIENSAEKIVLTIEEVSKMPQDFEAAQAVTLQEQDFRVLTDEEEGTWKAYTEKNGVKYVISGKAETEEAFLEEAIKLF